MSIEPYYYAEIDKVLFRKELNVDPTDRGLVRRSFEEIAISDAKQMLFWTKLKPDIVIVENPDEKICRLLALNAFTSNARISMYKLISARPEWLQKL